MNSHDRRQVLVCSSWLLSAIMHFMLMVAVAIVQRPAGHGRSAANDLRVSWATSEPFDSPAATFIAAATDDVLELEPPGPSWDDDIGAEEPTTDIQVSLTGLTSSSFGQNGTTERSAKNSSSGSPNRRSDEAPSDASPAAQAEFFGTVAKGDRFVYILDMSGSMESDRDLADRDRFDRAREELLRSVDQLAEHQSFYVILFSDEMRPMFSQKADDRSFLKATSENKDRLKSWLELAAPRGGTNPNGALQLGVSLQPSAVFLLSDGRFNVEQAPVGAVMFRKLPGTREEIIDQSSAVRVPIHTIAFEDSGGAETMEQLANDTAGVYRFVPPPPPEDLMPNQPRSPSRRRSPTRVVSSLPPTPEQLAVKLLTIGKGHETLGHRDKALDCYRRIAKEYPTTDAAEQANERTSQLTR